MTLRAVGARSAALLCAALCLLVARPALAYGTCSGKKMIRSGGLSCEDRQQILDWHNRLRQQVALGQVRGQPSAANMKEMVWDESLAAVAQRWADQCTVAHDHARDDGRFPVGQNLAATWTTRTTVTPEPDFHKHIDGWFNEVRSYNYQTSGFSAATGHYSQLVWGDTHLVGCGYSFYYDRSKGYTKLYVCNYGPGGNVLGEKPYKDGYPSCTSYGMKGSQKYQGLCEVNGYQSLGPSCGHYHNYVKQNPQYSGYTSYYGK
ncbi:Venom allergen 5 [Gryllus bimaculatus]|nr:Venom allergen 5 [Gryllus bimaculatus]